MVTESQVDRGLLSPDARKCFDETVAKGVITFRQLAEIARSEGWRFGIGVGMVDYMLAQRDLGKIEIMQPFPDREVPHNIYIVSRSLFNRQKIPEPR